MRTEADFEGVWALSRQIDDRRAGQTGVMTGQAALTQAGPARLRYAEEGQMQLGTGPVLLARRVYHWHFAAGRVVVTFEDERDFHSFVADGQGAGTDHPCGDDTYRVVYDFTRWPVWQAVWDVAGPRKDYTMISTYTPA